MAKTYSPGQVQFRRDNWQQLWMKTDTGKEIAVRVKMAFPLTEPEGFIIISDTDGKFMGMLERYKDLPPESVALLEEELERDYFIPQILKIDSIHEEYRVNVWSVQTDRGPRRFEVRNRRRDIRWLSDEHIVIQDADGNKYEIKNMFQLDKDTQQLLEIEA